MISTISDPQRFSSGYLVPGVTPTMGRSFHIVQVSFSPQLPSQGGSLHLDPNVCGLDELGDPTMCTKMATMPIDFGLSFVKEKDGKRVYDIVAAPPAPPLSPAMRLVTLPLSDHLFRARLLILKSDKTIDRIIDLYPDATSFKLPYDPRAGQTVLCVGSEGGFVRPAVYNNRVPATHIYGDGKVVFVDPAQGSDKEICEGHLVPEAICRLLELLQQEGFLGWQAIYGQSGGDEAAETITLQLRGQPAKRVACYGGAAAAPSGFMDCYQRLQYPQIQPMDVRRYERHPITAADLKAGWYYGMEYQKKLNTPRDWVWVEAGRSSRWHSPGHPNM